MKIRTLDFFRRILSYPPEAQFELQIKIRGTEKEIKDITEKIAFLCKES